jgi:hypothetical protein
MLHRDSNKAEPVSLALQISSYDSEVLYLFHRRWRFRVRARLNVSNEKTYRSPSGRPLILLVLLVVTSFQLGRYVIPTFIFTHLPSSITIFHSLLYLYTELNKR